MIIRLVMLCGTGAEHLIFFFMTLSVLSMTIGNLSAVVQDDLKRLLAYSSIAHAGYILMGLVILTSSGMQAMVLYLPIYLFMNMGAFFVVYIIEHRSDHEPLLGRSECVANPHPKAICIAGAITPPPGCLMTARPSVS